MMMQDLDPIMASLINTAVREHLDISEVVGVGLLVSQAKPSKPKGPKTSLRPVTLLNTIRKALSLVIFRRKSSSVDRYLEAFQPGFRRGRSTADVEWTQRWLLAKARRSSRWVYHMLCIDMKRAVDSINRERLLEVEHEIAPSEVKFIRLLLANTSLIVKVGKARADPFCNNIGTPQGDGLSPVLFTCYLEAAIREAKKNLPPRPPEDADLPHETRYADDGNFCITSLEWLQSSLPIIADTLCTWSLKVNTQKTEWVTVSSKSSS